MNKTSIILTRPRLQNAGLQAELAKLGFPTLVFPLLEIEEIKARAISNNCDGVIFTSPKICDRETARILQEELKVKVEIINDFQIEKLTSLR